MSGIKTLKSDPAYVHIRDAQERRKNLKEPLESSVTLQTPVDDPAYVFVREATERITNNRVTLGNSPKVGHPFWCATMLVFVGNLFWLLDVSSGLGDV